MDKYGIGNTYSREFVCILTLLKEKKQIGQLTTHNPVVEIEGELSYRSVSFSIVGSGLQVGEFQVGFPPGWGKAINFFQFTGKEVTLEVYITSNQNIIMAIEGEGHDGEQKRLTLEDALEEGLIDMEDARV